MNQILRFAVLSLLVVSATSFAASPKGVECVEDYLPDGNKEAVILKKTSGEVYDVVFRLQLGDERDGAEEEASDAVIATGLTCTFGIQHPALASCSKKDAKGKVIAHYSVSLVHTTEVDIIVPGKEFDEPHMLVSVSSPELKDNIHTARFPNEVSPNGYWEREFIGEKSCQVLQ